MFQDVSLLGQFPLHRKKTLYYICLRLTYFIYLILSLININ